jgi:hypothetical protein
MGREPVRIGEALFVDLVIWRFWAKTARIKATKA